MRIISLIIFSIFSSEVISSPKEDFSNLIERLSKKGVIRGSESKFLDKDPNLKKEDFLLFTSNLLDSIDGSKVSLEDFRAVESLLSEIGEYLSRFNNKIKEHDGIIQNLEKDHAQRMEELDEGLENIAFLENKVEKLDGEVKKYFSFEEHGLRSFLRDWDLKGRGAIFFPLSGTDTSYKSSFDLKIIKENSYFHFSNEGESPHRQYIESKIFFSDKKSMEFHSHNWRKIVLSPNGAIIYDTFNSVTNQNELSSISLSVEKGHLVVGIDGPGRNIWGAGLLKYSFLNSAIGFSRELGKGAEKLLESVDIFEIDGRVGVIKGLKLGAGYIHDRGNHYGNINLHYGSQNIVAEAMFKLNKLERDLRVDLKYILGKNSLNLFGLFDLRSKERKINDKIMRWKISIESSALPSLNMRLAFFKEGKDKNEKVFSKIEYSAKRAKLTVGSLLSNDRAENGGDDDNNKSFNSVWNLRLALHLAEGINFFVDGSKSNFKYYDALINEKGVEYSLLSSGSGAMLEGNRLLIGFEIEI